MIHSVFAIKDVFLFDPLSLFFVFVILLVSVPSALYSIHYLKGAYPVKKITYAWVMLVFFVLSMIAVVMANNALFFLIAWEIMSLLSFFLVVFDTERWKSVKAGIIYIIMTHIGTAFITAAFLLMHTYAHSFDLTSFATAGKMMPPHVRNIVFVFFLIGFGTKAGIVPLHIWLPYAHPQAPSHISSIMSGVMIKTAIYGLIRFVIMILGVQAFWWGNLILSLASVSCLVGVMYALMEQDIKRLLAFSSVENIGIILLGVGASMVFISLHMPLPALFAMAAGLYHLLNHAVFKSLLFLSAGNVYKATGVRDIEKLGGLIKTMPWTAFAFLAGSMAIAALPPFSGFVSEWLTLQALFSGVVRGGSGGVKVLMALYASVLAFTGGLAAACFVKAFGITFLAAPRSEEAKRATEASPLTIYIVVSLAVLCLTLGLFAAPVLQLIGQIAAYATGLPGENLSITMNTLAISPAYSNEVLLSVPLVAGVLILIILIVFVFTYIILGRRKVTPCPTWGCGYYTLDTRTEYTGTAFSKPFRIALNFFYRPYRKTEEIKESYYHVTSRRYETAITPVFTKYLYKSAVEKIFGTANILRKMQSGSIHFYLAYIFLAVVLLLVFIGKFS